MFGPPTGEKPADSMSILTFDNVAHWQRWRAKMQSEELVVRVREDEKKFADRESFIMVVVGEVCTTENQVA